MNFNLFNRKKNVKRIDDLLTSFTIYNKILEQLAKAQSLQKLNRNDESKQVLLEAERILVNNLNKNLRDKYAHIVLALFYREARAQDKAETILIRLLKPADFQLTEEEKDMLTAELQKIQRERPSQEKTIKDPEGFSQVYCCQNCGRLHNFVSMPCPNCDWSAKTLEEIAQSVVLSNSYIKVAALLILSRQIADGRDAHDVVPKLTNDAKVLLNDAKRKQGIEKILSLLNETEHKNHRSINQIRECAECGDRILLSSANECEKCGEPLNWPDMLRSLVCMDNILWLFERRMEVSSEKAEEEFVCILVAMINDLLRKQEPPSEQHRKYALSLLKEMRTICDRDKGAVIDTKNVNDMQMYLVKANMREDSESFGMFWFNELRFFADIMTRGVK